MSETLERLRRGYDAWNRRDWEELFSLLHPDMEWMPMEGTLLGGPFRGHDQVREFLETLMDAWDEFRIELEDLVERDDQVLAFVRVRSRARDSGIELDERWAHLWTARDGLAARLQVFSDRRAATEAFGLPPP
ncbi:MAG: nuclear transport factor 2 family protein [Solirubrobacterales bacterium]